MFTIPDFTISDPSTDHLNQEGRRPYPVACLEIFLLDQARERSKRAESTVFAQLKTIFDWQINRRQQANYLQKLSNGYTFVLTDSNKQILWTSHSFMTMTGYTHREVAGQTPRMLQGVGTNPDTLRYVSSQLRQQQAVKADLLNYRKGGDPYLCRLEIDPLFNVAGELTHFLAVEQELV
ncbi:hypothetical protein GCM10027578_06310 [Spirosoma luteolum]